MVEPLNDCNAVSESNDYAEGNVIYVFEGEPDLSEIGTEGLGPYTTVEARDEDLDGNYEYRAALMPGTYTIAATCQGGNDNDSFDDLDLTTFFLTSTSGGEVVTFEAADSDADIVGPSF